jgi:hypothetical protein
VQKRLILFVVWLLIAVGMPAWGQGVEYGRDLHGRAVTSLGDSGAKAVALFFVASDCPISNRTFPEMKRLREAFTLQGVRFWFVYANAGEKPETVRAHQQEFDEDGDVILDTAGTLAGMTGARVTPEVAVLRPQPGPAVAAPKWTPVYVGRVDDRYVRLGLERPQITQHFGQRVMEEVLQGRPVEKPVGSPIGCTIIRPAAAKAGR